MDVGCHVLDRIDYLCGPLSNVSGTTQRRSNNQQLQQQPLVEDYVHLEATIGDDTKASEFNGRSANCRGAQVSCTWDFSESTLTAKDELIITGSNGAYIKCAGMSPSLPVFVYSAQGELIQKMEFASPQHSAQPMIQAVTNDLLTWKRMKQKKQETESPPPPPQAGEERKPAVPEENYLSRGDNALRTSTVLDAILKSYYGGREIGYWNRPEMWPGLAGQRVTT